MSFIVRALTIQETNLIDLGARGISLDRIPTFHRCYALDEKRRAICAQLVGKSHEMRDGLYYYVLLWRNRTYVFTWEYGCVAELDVKEGGASIEALRIVKEAMDALVSAAEGSLSAESLDSELNLESWLK